MREHIKELIEKGKLDGYYDLTYSTEIERKDLNMFFSALEQALGINFIYRTDYQGNISDVIALTKEESYHKFSVQYDKENVD